MNDLSMSRLNKYIVNYLDDRGNECTINVKAEDSISAEVFVRGIIHQPIKIAKISFFKMELTPEQRDKLQEDYVQQIVDDMDLKTLCAFVYDSIDCTLDDYSNNELIDEVNKYYPHLLNNETQSN